MAYVAGTSKYYQDIPPRRRVLVHGRLGWITGHSYIVYGPLALGTTTVIYEGVPNYPDGGRPWRIAESSGEHLPHLAHAIRMLRKVGPEEPKKYGYHFKHMTTVGEPIRLRGLALVPLRGRQGRGGHRRHLVADRERRIPRQHAAACSR